MNDSLKIWGRLALWGCLITVVLTVALDAAVRATPWETRDSTGRAMGFNDRFSAEHYRIAFGNLRAGRLLNARYAYEWLEIGVIITGIRVLGGGGSMLRPWVWRFFLLQSAGFFLGWLALVFMYWPQMLLRLSRFEMDREDFVDIPFTWAMAQPPWVLTSAVIAGVLFTRTRRPLNETREVDPVSSHR